METEDKIFGLIAHAEDAQKALRDFQVAAREAVKTLPEAARAAIRDAAREFIVQGAETASRGLLDASSEAKTAATSLRRTGILQGVFVLAMGMVVAVGTVAVVWWSTSSLRDEAAELRSTIATLKRDVAEEQRTFQELSGKTWRLELATWKEERGIILPKGVKVDRTAPLTDKSGRIAIILKP